MKNRIKLLASLFTITLGLNACGDSGTSDNSPSRLSEEEQFVATMKSIAGSWRNAINLRYPLVVECTSSTYAVRLLKNTGEVSFDVRKTDSVINPYVGVVEIKSIVLKNRGHAKATASNGCFKTSEEALAHTSDDDTTFMRSSGQPLTKRMIAEYEISDSNVTLAKANGAFREVFHPDILKPNNQDVWRDMYSVRTR